MIPSYARPNPKEAEAVEPPKESTDVTQEMLEEAVRDMEGSEAWAAVDVEDANRRFLASEGRDNFVSTEDVDRGVWGDVWSARRMMPEEVDAAFNRILEDDPIPPSEPCKGPHYHLSAAQRLIGPTTPITRSVLDFGVGTGKTRAMIDAVGSYWYDRRPIVLMCPTKGTEENMYLQMLSYPCAPRDLRLHAALRLHLPGLLRSQGKQLGMSFEDWRAMFSPSEVDGLDWGEPGCCSVDRAWSDDVVDKLWRLCTFKRKGKATKNAIVDTLALMHNSPFSLAGATRNRGGESASEGQGSILSVRRLVREVWCGVAVKPLRVIGGTEGSPFPWIKSKFSPVIRSRPFPPVPDRVTNPDLDGIIVIVDEAHKIRRKDKMFSAMRNMNPDNSVLILATATLSEDIIDMLHGDSGRGYVLSLPDARGIFPTLTKAIFHKVSLTPRQFKRMVSKLRKTAALKHFVKRAKKTGDLPSDATPSKVDLDDVAAALFNDLVSSKPSKEAKKCITRMQELSNTQTSFTMVNRYYKPNDADAKLMAVSNMIKGFSANRFPVLVMIRNEHGLCAMEKRLQADLDGYGIQVMGRLDVTKDCKRKTDASHVQSDISRTWRKKYEFAGKRIVLLANTSTMSEGVNMAGARTQIFANPFIDATIADQSAGRARRGCKYYDMDDETNPIELHILATVAEGDNCITGDEIAARVLQISEERNYLEREAVRRDAGAYVIRGSVAKGRYFKDVVPTSFCSAERVSQSPSPREFSPPPAFREFEDSDSMWRMMNGDAEDTDDYADDYANDDADAMNPYYAQDAKANIEDREEEGWLDWAKRIVGLRSAKAATALAAGGATALAAGGRKPKAKTKTKKPGSPAKTKPSPKAPPKDKKCFYSTETMRCQETKVGDHDGVHCVVSKTGRCKLTKEGKRAKRKALKMVKARDGADANLVRVNLVDLATTALATKNCHYNAKTDRCNLANRGGMHEKCTLNKKGSCVVKRKTARGRVVPCETFDGFIEGCLDNEVPMCDYDETTEKCTAAKGAYGTDVTYAMTDTDFDKGLGILGADVDDDEGAEEATDDTLMAAMNDADKRVIADMASDPSIKETMLFMIQKHKERAAKQAVAFGQDPEFLKNQSWWNLDSSSSDFSVYRWWKTLGLHISGDAGDVDGADDDDDDEDFVAMVESMDVGREDMGIDLNEDDEGEDAEEVKSMQRDVKSWRRRRRKKCAEHTAMDECLDAGCDFDEATGKCMDANFGGVTYDDVFATNKERDNIREASTLVNMKDNPILKQAMIDAINFRRNYLREKAASQGISMNLRSIPNKLSDKEVYRLWDAMPVEFQEGEEMFYEYDAQQKEARRTRLTGGRGKKSKGRKDRKKKKRTPRRRGSPTNMSSPVWSGMDLPPPIPFIPAPRIMAPVVARPVAARPVVARPDAAQPVAAQHPPVPVWAEPVFDDDFDEYDRLFM